MQQVKATGAQASALKYDILTALMVLSSHDQGTDGRLAGRLTLLITARFNWQRGTFASGQREIARLWGVTERTAKRELAAMRVRGWITVKRQAARGRVAEHSIDMGQVLEATRPHWAAVGPDFVARLGAGRTEVPATPTNVVPLRSVGAMAEDDGSVWAAASRTLMADDAALHRAWFGTLKLAEQGPAAVTLMAPTRFAASYITSHLTGRILAAVSRIDPSVTAVKICGPD